MKYPMCVCTNFESRYEAFLPDFLEYDISCNDVGTLREVKECIQERFNEVFTNEMILPNPSPIEEIRERYIFFKTMFIELKP